MHYQTYTEAAGLDTDNILIINHYFLSFFAALKYGVYKQSLPREEKEESTTRIY